MKNMQALLFWLPRILAILAISFISMFAMDSFSGSEPLLTKIGHFIVHLTPSFVLAGILVVAWKWERIGGTLFVLIGAGLAPFIYHLNHVRNGFTVQQSLLVILLINGPFILVGLLFWLSYLKGHKSLAAG